MVKTSGVRGLFQGVTATAARDAPYAGMYLVCYEKGKEVACESFPAIRQGIIRHRRPVQANVTVRMSADEIARLILPEWGVPSGLIYSGCGMSFVPPPPSPSHSSHFGDIRMILILRCNGSYDGYFCYFSSGLC